jgi:DNA/RNA endonuclease G (NUC1)
MSSVTPRSAAVAAFVDWRVGASSARCAWAGLWLAAALAVSPISAAPRTVLSHAGDAANWAALRWTAEETARFGGEPVLRSESGRTLLLVRYSFYVSDYDLARRYPVWVAHVDRVDSFLKLVGRRKGEWGRSHDEFKPDERVVEKAQRLKIPYASNESFTNANPPGLPDGPKGDEKITRGHLASNAEMKSLGEPEEGLKSQEESFSLANVVPQMQRHNAPIWAKLEDDCIEWAAKLGGVSVISGPVYSLEPKQPPPMNRLLYTTGKDGVGLPIPTHMFKIVIGRKDGRPVAVGFLVPHRADLKPADLDSCVVPIRRIEELTGINFMPKLGAYDTLKTQADTRWLGWVKAGAP